MGLYSCVVSRSSSLVFPFSPLSTYSLHLSHGSQYLAVICLSPHLSQFMVTSSPSSGPPGFSPSHVQGPLEILFFDDDDDIECTYIVPKITDQGANTGRPLLSRESRSEINWAMGEAMPSAPHINI